MHTVLYFAQEVTKGLVRRPRINPNVTEEKGGRRAIRVVFLSRNPKNTYRSKVRSGPESRILNPKTLRIDSKSLLVVYTFGFIGLIGGSLFLIDGARQSYLQDVQSKTWPAVEARVIRCSLVEVPVLYKTGSMRLPSKHGIKSYISCRFAYHVGGVARETSARAGSSVITDQRPLDLVTPKVTPAKLSGWVLQSPPRLHSNHSL